MTNEVYPLSSRFLCMHTWCLHARTHTLYGMRHKRQGKMHRHIQYTQERGENDRESHHSAALHCCVFLLFLVLCERYSHFPSQCCLPTSLCLSLGRSPYLERDGNGVRGTIHDMGVSMVPHTPTPQAHETKGEQRTSLDVVNA